MLLICLFALAVSFWALFLVSRLDERHEHHERAVETIRLRLDEIRQNGEQQKELLHLLIKGHVEARRD